MAGGALGALARWGVDELFDAADGQGFPMATLAVNVTGAFLLGALGILLVERAAGAGNLRTFLLIGVLGSYTTFSAMALEGVLLIDSGDGMTAMAYWVATLILGLTAGMVGVWLARARA